MTNYPDLIHLSIDMLIAGAGGDPWQADQTLQVGAPDEIAQLAGTFRAAGGCVGEADLEFSDAKKRFEASWNRESGEHPINDGAELRSLARSLTFQKTQLPLIAADLETVAATLAEAQSFSAADIEVLDGQLHVVDALIGEALADELDTSGLQQDAITITGDTLASIEGLREEYADTLAQSLMSMRADGYDPAQLSGVFGDRQPTRAERDEAAVDAYEAEQRAKDQALVDGSGPMTQAKADAAARLHDDMLVNDPKADPAARHLASERLDDFVMARSAAVVPPDPLMGSTPQDRARSRLELQRLLEQGGPGRPALSRDAATRILDQSESLARILTVQRAMKLLEHEGMSRDKAKDVVGLFDPDSPWKATTERSAIVLGDVSDGAGGAARGLPGDARALTRFGKLTGTAGSLFEAVVAYDAVEHGAPKGETWGKWAGGTAAGGLGAWGTAILVSTIAGPEATFVATLAAGIATGKLGDWAGGIAGRAYDRAHG